MVTLKLARDVRAGGGASMVAIFKETGAEEMRRMVRVLACCRESVLDPYSLEELAKLQRAAWASAWDVYVDDLNEDQRNAAILLGEVPAFLDGPRGLEAVPSSMMPAADVHDWLCHTPARPLVGIGPDGREDLTVGEATQALARSLSEWVDAHECDGLRCGAEPDEARSAALVEAQAARRAAR